MAIDRRHFIASTAAVSLAAALPRTSFAAGGFNPKPGAWRNFEIVTTLEIAERGEAQAWVPVPALTESEWIKPQASTWTANGAAAKLWRDPNSDAELLHVTWTKGEAAPVVKVTSRFATRDRALDLAGQGAAPLPSAAHKHYTAATELIPTDGIVKETSDKITASANSDVAKARAIYEWIIDNTFRDAKVRGCGIGDIAAMLRTGNLGGKCADLNALFVGLVRAAGLPARDVYGLRVAASQFGYRSLGANSDNVTKAQHCRAEVFLAGIGWTPADPADVRKVVLEEPPGNLAIDAQKVVDARQTLLGAWEGNWLAYNTAHDVALPGSKGPKLGFLMYPQAEVAGQRLDCLDPDTFKYSIVAREVAI